MNQPGRTARAEAVAALRFQIDATLTDAGRMLAELQEAVGSLRTLAGQLAQVAEDDASVGRNKVPATRGTTTRRKRPIEERFWSKVVTGPADECWPWNARISRSGYGEFHYDGNVIGSHRMAWMLTHEPIEPGLFVMHKCDSPSCCNPAHLSVGTHADNVADKVAKGRQSRGESHTGSKVSEADVIAMRKALAGDIPIKAIAATYGISDTQVRRIRDGKRWGHILNGKDDTAG